MKPNFLFSANQELGFTLYLPLCFFSIYLLWIILTKATSKKNTYTAVNKIHFKVFLLYLLTAQMIYLETHQLQTNLLVNFIIGIYIYFSLHYLFIFQLIALCKKSISIAILDSISKIGQHDKIITEKSLKSYMTRQNNGIKEIAKDRLNQMIYLRLANINKQKYIISIFGKIIYKIMKFLLKLYNLNRL